MNMTGNNVMSGQNGQQDSVNRFNLKKIKKPLLERKRRERINRALSHLKTLILDNIRIQGGTQTAKLDKADILEMTVNHLSLLHYGRNIVSMATDKFFYKNGYQRCSTDAMAYLSTFAQPEANTVSASGSITPNYSDNIDNSSPECMLISQTTPEPFPTNGANGKTEYVKHSTAIISVTDNSDEMVTESKQDENMASSGFDDHIKINEEIDINEVVPLWRPW